MIECPCCGNCYCSDKCKATDHQKKLIHHTWTDFKHIYESIMKSDQNIRVVTISDLKGEIMYPVTAKALGICSIRKRARNPLKWRWKDGRYALNLHQSLGRGKYVLAEYEMIKRITMPLGENHLLYVTTEVACDHSLLIETIHKLYLA